MKPNPAVERTFAKSRAGRSLLRRDRMLCPAYISRLKSIGLIFVLFISCISLAYSERSDDIQDTSKIDWPVAEELSRYGIKVGMPYSRAKALMLKNGWVIDPDEVFGSSNPYKSYPEIVCGEGYDAVCAAGFSKQNRHHTLDVRKVRSRIVIRGSS